MCKERLFEKSWLIVWKAEAVERGGSDIALGHVMIPCNNDCHFSIDSHVGVLVGDDLALVRHVDLLPLLVGAQDLLRVDVLDHWLVVIAAKLLERKCT